MWGHGQERKAVDQDIPAGILGVLVWFVVCGNVREGRGGSWSIRWSENDGDGEEV